MAKVSDLPSMEFTDTMDLYAIDKDVGAPQTQGRMRLSDIALRKLDVPLTINVSTTGNDISGDGSSGSPFRLISRAWLEIQKYAITAHGSCDIVVGSGVFTEQGNVTLSHPNINRIRILGNSSVAAKIATLWFFPAGFGVIVNGGHTLLGLQNLTIDCQNNSSGTGLNIGADSTVISGGFLGIRSVWRGLNVDYGSKLITNGWLECTGCGEGGGLFIDKSSSVEVVNLVVAASGAGVYLASEAVVSVDAAAQISSTNSAGVFCTRASSFNSFGSTTITSSAPTNQHAMYASGGSTCTIRADATLNATIPSSPATSTTTPIYSNGSLIWRI